MQHGDVATLTRLVRLAVWARRFALAEPPGIGVFPPHAGTRPLNFCAAAAPSRRAGGARCRSGCSPALLRPCSARPSGGSTSAGAAFHRVNAGFGFSTRVRSTKWLRASTRTSAAERPLQDPQDQLLHGLWWYCTRPRARGGRWAPCGDGAPGAPPRTCPRAATAAPRLRAGGRSDGAGWPAAGQLPLA